MLQQRSEAAQRLRFSSSLAIPMPHRSYISIGWVFSKVDEQGVKPTTQPGCKTTHCLLHQFTIMRELNHHILRDYSPFLLHFASR
jgi:hypothetical protein